VAGGAANWDYTGINWISDTNGDVRGYMNIDKFRNQDDITRFGKQKRQAQLQAAIARHHQEQAQYTQRLADKRLSYKTKAQELAD
ncbi:hypothetical protein ONQ60_27025, partial [Salmonella enterica subsp. enterica serovar Virginia]|nr:hypothetical protein [Salmonella enterica subsp. enterica serovar Virginia]